MSLELQQRSCEYLSLGTNDLKAVRYALVTVNVARMFHYGLFLVCVPDVVMVCRSKLVVHMPEPKAKPAPEAKEAADEFSSEDEPTEDEVRYRVVATRKASPEPCCPRRRTKMTLRRRTRRSLTAPAQHQRKEHQLQHPQARHPQLPTSWIY